MFFKVNLINESTPKDEDIAIKVNGKDVGFFFKGNLQILKLKYLKKYLLLLLLAFL